MRPPTPESNIPTGSDASSWLTPAGPPRRSEAFIGVGFLAYALLLALQLAYFTPQVRKARTIAERDLEKGDELSQEYQDIAQRIGQVGSLAGLIVVVTIFFMTYKPFL